ncbi:hypothetical protein D3C73_1359660 [compost metagenome]
MMPGPDAGTSGSPNSAVCSTVPDNARTSVRATMARISSAVFSGRETVAPACTEPKRTAIAKARGMKRAGSHRCLARATATNHRS